jgi:hypothetical protein
MRTALTVILLASLAVSTSAATSARTDTASVLQGAEDKAAEPAVLLSAPKRILFIGNSHTFTNGGIDLHVERMAAAADPARALTSESETISAATLEIHYQLDSQGRIPEGHFDVVVLQGHIPRSHDPSAASFLEYARRFDAIAAEYGAETVFFMSWPHIDFREVKLNDIVEAHRQISTELDAKVAPVAKAMRQVRRERPDLKMLSSDGVHASWAGSYLTAAVIYATLFERSPEGLPYTFGVDEDDAAFLQRIAWKAVSNWNAGS